MSPSADSPTVEQTQDGVYDYIICGGGTTGCVVAGRLAENPNVSILVLEAGEHSDDVEASQMAAGFALIVDTKDDWNIRGKPGAGTNGRPVHLSRGKFLGGSSGCNGTLCVRGSKQDYDDWGVKGWNGDEMFKYMSKAENFHSKPWFKADLKSHGANGLLHTEPHDLAPISQLLLESYQSQGLPLDHDMFTTGATPHGCGHATRTVYNGLCSTAADYVLKKNHRSNITIMTGSFVDKVRLEKLGGALRATGVDVVSASGSKSSFAARKEVIVSGGAYCSPAILLRSGIGPRADIEKLGISNHVDLPGVGKNLMDHLICFMFYQVNKDGLTTDDLIHREGALNASMELFKTKKSGFLSTFPFGSFAFARLDDRLSDSELWNNAKRQPGRDPMGLTPKQPNVEYFSTECYFGPPYMFDKPPTKNENAFSIIAELFSPRSRGTVTIDSTDPFSNPIVDHNYLSDPLDLLVLAEACRFGNEVVTKGSGTKDIIQGAWPTDLVFHKHTQRDQWAEFVKENATTCYHPGGTCAMGPASNPSAVVDAELRVHGVLGLRVADTSIMPNLNGGHTQMPAYAIGEKAADLIKEAASRKGGSAAGGNGSTAKEGWCHIL